MFSSTAPRWCPALRWRSVLRAVAKRKRSAIGVARSPPVPVASEEGRLLLLVQPGEELLEARIGQYLLHRIGLIPKLVVRPRLVDEILAGLASGDCLSPAFALRYDMVPARLHMPAAEYALALVERPLLAGISLAFCVIALHLRLFQYIELR